jgi:hypothetical protein
MDPDEAGNEVTREVPVRGIRRCNRAQWGGHLRWNRDHNAAINIRQSLFHFWASGGRKRARRHHTAHSLLREHATSQPATGST